MEPTILVYCFTVTKARPTKVSLKALVGEFGENIPNYLQYEGGAMGFCTFLCCVEVGVSIQEICDKYEFECGTLYPLELSRDTYNNLYTIYPTYSREGDMFKLELNEPINEYR